MSKITRITFVGAPSTGKSTLCRALAKQYQTVWMEEFGKEYWRKHQVDRRLKPEQLLEIGIGHNRGEDALMDQAHTFLFCDTNAMVTATYARYYHGDVVPELRKLAEQCATRYGHTFLCDTDIPYEDSYERSGVVFTKKFQEMVIEDLDRFSIPYQLLSGDVETRLLTVQKSLG